MSPLDLKLWRDLGRLKGQVLAIALVMASGVALLIMSLASLESLRETTNAYYERYRFADVFAVVKRAPERLLTRVADIDGVQYVESRITQLATVDVASFPEPVMAQLVSVPDHAPPVLNRLVLRSGRLPSPGESDEAVLNEPFALAHDLRPGDTLHAILNGRRKALRVVGTALSPEFIYSIGPGSMMPDSRRYGVIWLGHESLASAYDFEGAFNDLTLTLRAGADADGVIAALDTLLTDYGGVGAYDRGDQVSNWFVSNELDQLENIASVLPTIFLAAAAFLTHLVLGRLVAIERGEIGLLKAIGYSDLAISAHYIKLVAAIVTVGVAIGWVAGYGLGRYSTAIYAENYDFPFLIYRPSVQPFLLGAGVCLLTALVGALGAVRKAAALPPAEAMRPPSPPAFRRRNRLLVKVLVPGDQLTRMMFRQVTRWPLRSALTIAGLSMSIAVSTLALQWPDAISYLVDSTFFRDQRQDITVSLAQPRSRSAVHDLARLPGVTAVEPQRVTAARIRFGPRERRVSVEGVNEDAWLAVVRDVEGDTIEVPDDGLVMSSKLAEVLGARRGDAVEVEFLDGQRRTRELVIARLYDSFVGMRTVMNIDALSRALGDAPSLDTALLRVDTERLDQLLHELKHLPLIEGATLRLASVQLFQDTMARIINVYVAFYLGFASILAFGVAYNSARVALSERGHELATLRVLGFARRDSSYVLLGELGLVLVASLPAGCLLGHLLARGLASSFETEMFRLPLVIEDATYGMATSVTLLAAAVSALIVWRRINALDLTLALKSRQ